MSKTTDTTLEETRLHHSIVHGLLKSLAGIYFNDIHQKVIMQFSRLIQLFYFLQHSIEAYCERNPFALNVNGYL